MNNDFHSNSVCSCKFLRFLVPMFWDVKIFSFAILENLKLCTGTHREPLVDLFGGFFLLFVCMCAYFSVCMCCIFMYSLARTCNVLDVQLSEKHLSVICGKIFPIWLIEHHVLLQQRQLLWPNNIVYVFIYIYIYFLPISMLFCPQCRFQT